MGSSSCLQFQIDQQVPDCSLSSSVRLLFRLNVNNIQETCQKNAASALAVGRRDLVQVLCWFRPLSQTACAVTSIPEQPAGLSTSSREPEMFNKPRPVNQLQGCSLSPRSWHREVPPQGCQQGPAHVSGGSCRQSWGCSPFLSLQRK